MKKTKEILKTIVDIIAVSTSKYEDASNRYKSLSDFIRRKDSSIRQDKPLIYIHGSFSLGTAVNPLQGTEFDLDIMCCLQVYNSSNISQRELKKKVGEEIIKYTEIHGMELPEDKKRAWTINYNEKSKFHIDILPSIPTFLNDIVYIPYKDSATYSQILDPWDKSCNPKGFLKWFRSISKSNYHKKLDEYAERNRIKVEAIPKYTIRSTLQNIVILLKRHSDIFFKNLKDDNINDSMIKKESISSIIITTLAGKAYLQEDDLNEAFFNVVDRIENYILMQDMDDFIHFKYNENFTIGNKMFKIVNPANTAENFTDKWARNPYKKMAFFAWLKQLKKDAKKLKDLIYSNSSDLEIVYDMFGERYNENLINFINKDIDSNEILYLEELKYYKNIIGEVNIKGYKSTKKIDKVDSYLLHQYKFNSDEPINKNMQLLFVAETNIQKPYDIVWQVTNKGSEAIKANQLRGELLNSEYFNLNSTHRFQRAEHTSYFGRHWVKCYVIKNEVVVAESKKFYVKVV